MKFSTKAFVLVLIFLTTALYAERYLLAGAEFYLDTPVSMSVVETTDSRISFAAENNAAYVQVKAEKPVEDIETHADSVMKRMGGTGEGVPFSYADDIGWFGSFTFAHSDVEYQSYLVIVVTGQATFTIVAFSPVETIESYNDLLVSAIDSFSTPRYRNFFPGPIGTFDRYYSEAKTGGVYFDLDGNIVEAELDYGLSDSEQFVIDREARLLKSEGTIEAWKRFYRMIFRDAYTDLLPAAEGLEPALAGLDKTEITKILLRYIQGYSYNRTGTLADIDPPVTAVSKRKGDCDTRAIILLTLLHYFGIDGILLVSTEYAHGLAAVDVPVQGAGYQFDSKKYIIAETTEDVALGLIAADMANPDYWIPVDVWGE